MNDGGVEDIGYFRYMIDGNGYKDIEKVSYEYVRTIIANYCEAIYKRKFMEGTLEE